MEDEATQSQSPPNAQISPVPYQTAELKAVINTTATTVPQELLLQQLLFEKTPLIFRSLPELERGRITLGVLGTTKACVHSWLYSGVT